MCGHQLILGEEVLLGEAVVLGASHQGTEDTAAPVAEAGVLGQVADTCSRRVHAEALLVL